MPSSPPPRPSRKASGDAPTPVLRALATPWWSSSAPALASVTGPSIWPAARQPVEPIGLSFLLSDGSSTRHRPGTYGILRQAGSERLPRLPSPTSVGILAQLGPARSAKQAFRGTKSFRGCYRADPRKSVGHELRVREPPSSFAHRSPCSRGLQFPLAHRSGNLAAARRC